MIKYYAYYNQGGYKDFYVGTHEEEVESKYYIPLLAIHERSLAENPDDNEMKSLVEHQRHLPKLITLSDKTIDYNYPSNARVLMSHGGYKVLYKSIGCSIYALAIRDIAGPKDVYGRQTPFNMMFIGDSQKDIEALDIIAEYIRQNISSFETEIGSIFVNDINENGLRCDIGILQNKLNGIIENGTPLMVDESRSPSVRMLVISNRYMLKSAIKEQNLNIEDINICYKCDGSTLCSMISRSQDILDSEQEAKHPTPSSTVSSSAAEKHSSPSFQAMLNIPKREDIELLWKYVKELEKRIVKLENSINHE